MMFAFTVGAFVLTGIGCLVMVAYHTRKDKEKELEFAGMDQQ